MKCPISEQMYSDSMLVPHDKVVNDALIDQQVDKGLKPNGVTIDMMRQNIEFYTRRDPLDRFAVASQVSANLSDKIKQTITYLKTPSNFMHL